MERLKKMAKALLRLHWAILLPLTAASAAGLVWVFLSGNDAAWFAYPIYVLAFYALVVLCIRLTPVVIRRAKAKTEKTAALTAEDKEKAFGKKLRQGMIVNLLYAAFCLVMSVVEHSIWMGSVGLYHLILTVINLCLAWFERKAAAAEDPAEQYRIGWSGFQTAGVLLLILHLTMTGMVSQRIWQGAVSVYPGVMIFAVAAFTFYKLTMAIIRVAQFRKNPSPIWGASRNINLSESMMSLFSLQAAMMAAFDDGTMNQVLMNSLTGGVVCLLAVSGAVGMIIHGKKKKENYKGESFYGE